MKKLIAVLLALILILSALPALSEDANPNEYLYRVWTLDTVSFLSTDEDIDEIMSLEDVDQGKTLRLNADSTMDSDIDLNALLEDVFELPFTIAELNLTEYTSFAVKSGALRLFPGGVSLEPEYDEEEEYLYLTYTGIAALDASDVAMTVTLAFGPDARQTLLNEVISALGETPYRAVYDALRAGETVQKGTISDTAKGLQQTLVAFGQDIAVDGNAGAKTMGALNAVQKAFELEETDVLDAEGYAQLLPRLIFCADPDQAYDMFSDSLGDEYDYILACAKDLAGLHFTAKSYFEQSQWGDWEARAEACVKDWPKTGQLWRNPAVSGSSVELTVKVNGDSDTATLVKIYTEKGVLAATLFIGGTGRATTYLPSGVYTIKDGSGEIWYGPEEAFGDDGYYEIMTFSGGEQTVKLQSGHAYTITMNVQEENPNAESVGSRWESWGDF